MKKTYKIEVECANCANKMEAAASKLSGVKAITVNFITQKLAVEFEDGADVNSVMKEIKKCCRKIESDCEIYE